ncbi:glycosyltransferase WbuB [Calothrix sp. HK-06]|nr:glycosyltransferase WbuB [Calothrix sp. HK-06]
MKSHSQGSKKLLPQFTRSKLDLQRYNSIKLSVITQFFPPDFAATGQLIEELVKQLGSFGVDVDVFTGQPGYAFQTHEAPAIEKLDGVIVKRSRTSKLWPKRVRGKAMNGVLFLIRAALHVLRHYRHRNVLLVTTAPPFLPFLGYLANLCTGIPYICLLYDLYPDIAVALKVIPQNHWLAKIWQNLNIRVWRQAKEIVVLSPNMKERIVQICPEIENKIYVIHSWANPKAIVPIAKKENWFAWKHNLVDKFTVLYSGNMGRCHDMDTIIEAAKELKDEPIQFVFIGGGAKRKEVMQQAELFGLTNFVFLPYQDKQVLPYSLTACDLSLVSIDMDMESLVAPSKLYPALAAGRPVAVICSKDSYLRELIKNAKCGSSFENGDGHGLAEYIRLLNSNTLLVEQMGKEGREYLLSNFTPEVISKEYLKVIRESIT